MSNAAAIKATFADFRLVKGRKVAQLVFELAIEEADAALRTLGGLPQPATEAWCGIARLVAEPKQEAPKRKFGDLPASQQAAMRCNEVGFQRFIVQRLRDAKRPVPGDESDADRAARYVREWCCVDSRSDIMAGRFTGDRWKELDDAYFGWQRGVA